MFERNIPAVLTLEMLQQVNLEPNLLPNSSKKIESLSDCVLVHKTKYMPKGILKTQRDILEAYTDTYVDDYPVQIKHERNTVHFALNGEVEDHKLGTFSNSKYIILVPGDNINSNNFIGGTTVDTYTDGSYTLPSNAIILCPKEEIEVVKQNNPNIKIVGYEGEYADNYGNLLLHQLGYKLEKIGEHGWINSNDSGVVIEEYEKLGLKVAPHFLSSEYKEEVIYEDIHKLFSRFEILKEKNQISIENISNVFLPIKGSIKIIINQLKNNKKTIKEKEYVRMIEIFQEEFNNKFGISLPDEFLFAFTNCEQLDNIKIDELASEMTRLAFRPFIYSIMEEYTNSYIDTIKNNGNALINPDIVFYDEQTTNCFFEALQSQNLITRDFIDYCSSLIQEKGFSNSAEINQYLSNQLNITISKKDISQLTKQDIDDVNKVLSHMTDEKIDYILNENSTYSFSVNIICFEDYEKANLIAEEISKEGEYEFFPYSSLSRNNIGLDPNMKVSSFYDKVMVDGNKIISSLNGGNKDINNTSTLEKQVEVIAASVVNSESLISEHQEVEGNSHKRM